MLGPAADLALFAYIISIYIFTFRAGYNVVSNIIAAIFMFFAVADILMRKKKIVFPSFVMFFLAFILVSCASYFTALDKSLVIESVKTLFIILVFLLVLTNYIDSYSKLKALVKYFVCSGVIASVYLLTSTDISGLKRIGDLLGNENAIGIIIGISSILCFYLIAYEKKYFYIIFEVIMLPTILMTGSRKAILMVVISILAALYFINRNSIKNKVKFFVVGIAAIFIIYYLVFNTPVFYMILGRRFEDLFNFLTGTGTNEGSILMRSYMTKLGFEMFKKRPVLGYGIDNYRVLLGSIYGLVTYSHNNYIELLVGTGIIGALAFYLTYMDVMLRLKKSCRSSQNKLEYVLLAINLAVIIIGYTLVHYTFKHLYIILAMGSIMSNVIGNNPAPEKLKESIS